MSSAASAKAPARQGRSRSTFALGWDHNHRSRITGIKDSAMVWVVASPGAAALAEGVELELVVHRSAAPAHFDRQSSSAQRAQAAESDAGSASDAVSVSLWE